MAFSLSLLTATLPGIFRGAALRAGVLSRLASGTAKAVLVGLLMLGGAVAPAAAQVQRSFLNLGFELPNLTNAGCRVYIGDSQVPGWITSAPAQGTEKSPSNCTPLVLNPTNGRIIEIWRGPRTGVTAREGQQFAELNAAVFSRLSQTVCLVPNEAVGWSFSHRGRSSDTVADVAAFLIGSQEIARVQTTNDGDGGVVSTTLGAATDAAATNGWRDYSGSFVEPGSGGTTNIGFNAVSSFGNDPTSGNFLDNIQVHLLPFVELGKASFSTLEGTSVDVPSIRVLGVVPPGGMTINVTVDGGSAALGSRYHTPGDATSFSVTIPAGDYGTGQYFDLGFTAPVDGQTNADETVEFSLQESADYLIKAIEVCGGVPQSSGTWTIRDNVPALSLVKTGTLADTNSDGGPSVGDVITYRFALTNTGNVPLTNVTISDLLPNLTITGGPLASLAVDATDSTTFTGTYAVTSGDIGAGSITNTATANATPQGGGSLPSNPSSVTIPLATAPAIEIVKSGALNDGNRGFAAVGDVITYSFLVTNTGNVPLRNVTITDSFLPTPISG